MKKKNPINESLNVLSNEEIETCNNLQQALELINKESVIPDTLKQPKREFIVTKNIDDLNLKSSDLITKNDAELDEISNQADQAFLDLMDIALNSNKSIPTIAMAAQAFLALKLNAKIAKTDAKLRKMKQELDEKKFELSLSKESKNQSNDDDFSDDDITIIP